MIMADESSGLSLSGGVDGFDDDGGDDNLTIDIDLLNHLLQDPFDPSENSPDMISNENTVDAGNLGDFQFQEQQMSGGSQELCADSVNPAAYGSETSGAEVWASGCSFDSAGNTSAVFGNSGECYSMFQGGQVTEMARAGAKSDVFSCSTTSSFDKGDSNCDSGHMEDVNLNFQPDETSDLLRHVGGNTDSKEASCNGWMANCSGGQSSYYNPQIENTLGFSGPESNIHSISIDNVTSTSSVYCHNSYLNSALGASFSNMQFGSNTDDAFLPDFQHFPADLNFQLLRPDDPMMLSQGRDETENIHIESAFSATEMPMVDSFGVNGFNFNSQDSGYTTAVDRFMPNSLERLMDDKASVMPFSSIESDINKKHTVCWEDANISKLSEYRSMVQPSLGIVNGGIHRKYSNSDGENSLFREDMKQSPCTSHSMLSQKLVKDEKGDIFVPHKKARVQEFTDTRLDLKLSDQYSLRDQHFAASYKKHGDAENEIDGKLIRSNCLGSHSRVSPESIQSNSSGNKSHVDEDSDICIIEDISQPARNNHFLPPGKALALPYVGASHHYAGVVAMRNKANDERFIFQAVLKDLSQPKSEASLPDGVLAVPLLKHQRIALSWMVQKETSSVHCSGGILADDQGLGKTVSTIALILKEKRPSLRVNEEVVKREQFETFDLDKDDDDVTEVSGRNISEVLSNQSSTGCVNSVAKGRPAGGTLVVCPTSVLRQWADELNKKVVKEANLSVLVYHGSTRTKDPYELAKHDVVLTTYSIVSMEVPKQPIVDEDDDEKRKLESNGVPPSGFSSGKKRKDPKKGTKNKKIIDSALLDSIVQPLAKVGWFRVVLDEAQSIKNHRTQVARACWGLRAKRRWCLSGTPIQNAIDDLYSYFRFLRYDPYAVYKSFCSTIKIPIQKSPSRGYKKLQAVLKTIMLRRTKSTVIDGERIINLPPKVVELKRVNFTDEERDFYTRLEADSRAQFQEYAAAGTVKQNYVNILLMLLRLRQACDHPLLVKGSNSSSLGSSSFEMARKLPMEKQQCLLKCLEASLALCGICNDAPEDAVVSICGHVFCNQCICEHLSGDDNQCPTSNCKVRLNVSLVFSKATLNGCLSYQPLQEHQSSEHDKAIVPYSEGSAYDSSKIRAALEVLQSLPKKQNANGSSYNSSNRNDNPQEIPSCSGSMPVNSVQAVGEKAIVFSQWTKMLDLLEACLKDSSIQYRRLDGTMSVVARDKAVKDFNTLPEVSVMIMSLKAASLGLNMVAACHVLLLDLWWNPTTEDQAIDRAHRIGQTRPVTVLRLTVKDTVEDRILALQQKKREMVASAFGEDEAGGRQTRLTVQDLEYLFMV